MSGAAMTIVLVAAVLHAGWNYLLKTGERKIAFIWLHLLVAVLLFFPMFVLHFPEEGISQRGWVCMGASALFHGLYFWFMAGAYERGDLSLVYPIFRGFGPLFVPVLAVVLLGEEISLQGGTGIALIVLGIYMLHLPSFSFAAMAAPLLAATGGASLWAMASGLSIAGYSLVDKIGVGEVPPPAYIYLMIVMTWLLLSPPVLWQERRHLAREWRLHRGKICTVGFFSIFTYLMILYAMTLAKVSYIVAIREVSIVLSALFGVVRLGERHALQKVAGAAVITGGVILIGLSR